MDEAELRTKMSESVRDNSQRVMDMYNAPFARHMGFEIDYVSEEEVRCSMKMQDWMMNSMQRVHGGAIYFLMDHTFAVLDNLMHDGTGQSMEVKYFRPATSDMHAVAKKINVSRSLGVYEVKVYSADDKLLASATATGFTIRKD